MGRRQVSQNLHIESMCSEAKLWDIRRACRFSAGRKSSVRLFIQHKSRQVGHRCLQVRLKDGLRPQGSPQNFQVTVDVIQRDQGAGLV